MEIERAVRGSSDARLRAKYDAAVYIIRRAYALYPYVRRVHALLFCCTVLYTSDGARRNV
jgi:hypothetical protein